MFGRVPSTRSNISESHIEISTRVPFLLRREILLHLLLEQPNLVRVIPDDLRAFGVCPSCAFLKLSHTPRHDRLLPRCSALAAQYPTGQHYLLVEGSPGQYSGLSTTGQR